MVSFTSEPEYTKSDEELIEYRRNYLRDCDNKEYRRLARKGQLDDHLQEKADKCRANAEDMVEQGTFPPQAWHWAIRETLLESERD